MDRVASVWTWTGEKLRTRPFALLGNLVGAVIFLGGLAYVYVEQNDTGTTVSRICKGNDNSDENKKHCHDLLDQLIKNPTNLQVTRLQQLLKENTP